ncbi:Hypothetical Protein XCAW_00295 [Xanthomonas citri subsp. citri Aw12879]|nr:Hypothetical Protein XCAW_00295 [Xanthomonas citri subsp. citri Aw12879]
MQKDGPQGPFFVRAYVEGAARHMHGVRVRPSMGVGNGSVR